MSHTISKDALLQLYKDRGADEFTLHAITLAYHAGELDHRCKTIAVLDSLKVEANDSWANTFNVALDAVREHLDEL